MLTVLYITFVDYGERKSGSSVRPFRFYQAFQNLGVRIIHLEGLQRNLSVRKQRVREIMKWLDTNRPDCCYIEPPAGPIFNAIDLRLIKRLHKMSVPMGIFYRDSYWRHPEWAYPHFPFWKKKLLRAMHKRDIRVFKENCDIIYFPSEEARDVFAKYNLPRTGILPPGCVKLASLDVEKKKTILYVGGVREADGVDDLLLALHKLNQSGWDISLILITRFDELHHLAEQSILEESWVSLHEASGEALNVYYKRADLGALPKKRHFYMDLAISVKALEYMSNNLPVLSTDCPAMASFIRANECGLVCESSVDGIAEAIAKYYSDDALFHELKAKTLEAANRNTWETRAKQVLTDLLQEETNETI